MEGTEFRKMRRFAQQLSEEECISILQRNTNGILAVQGDGGYPYAVPLSYAFCDGKIYFHSALQGHKIDALRAEEKCSFCVVDKDQIVPEEFTTYFRSVIIFGKAHIIEEKDEMLKALNLLADKYSPEQTVEQRHAEISHGIGRVAIIVLTIEHMTGKQARELMHAK
jgi:hypothetical protein